MVRLVTAISAKKFIAVEALVRSRPPTGVAVAPLYPIDPKKLAVSAWTTFRVPTPCPMAPVTAKVPVVFKVRLALAPVETLRAKLTRLMEPELPEPRVSVALDAPTTSPTAKTSVPASRLEVPIRVTLPKVIFWLLLATVPNRLVSPAVRFNPPSKLKVSVVASPKVTVPVLIRVTA